MMRATLAVAIACLSLGTLAAAGEATAAIRKTTEIPAQPLGSALTALAKEFDFQVLYRTETVSDLKSPGAMGALTPEEALGKVLTGTGLTYKYLDDNTITIIPVAATNAGSTNASGSTDGANSSKEAGKKTSQQFRVAQLDQGASSNAIPVGSAHSQENSSNPSTALTEIVVTAQKHEERLEDVPVPVTALSAQALIDNNEVRIQDYYTSVPGLSFTEGNHGEPYLAIRGITTSPFGNPTVGIVIDDVPFGSSTGVGGGYMAPDIDPNDLARVEILRGPQGTLYGANSMGGLIKYVTVDPSTEGVSGHVQVGTDTVYNGNELGYTARGTINVPLTDTWAVRASAFARLDPGYIDNVEAGDSGANETRVDGARLSSLWRPSDALSLKINALIQDNKSDGYAEVFMQPNLGDLQQEVLNGAGSFDDELESYTANLTANLGPVNLVSLTGYNTQSNSGWSDVTAIYGPYADSLFGVAGASSQYLTKTDKFTQEIRLSVPVGPRIEWLMGGFYTHEKSPVDSYYYAADPTTGAVVASLAQVPIVTTYSERAAFTDLTFHFTDQFDVQIGGRESWIQQSLTETLEGVLIGHTSVSQGNSKADAFTYLVTPRFRLSPDLMIYARLASGYRPGGPNVNSALAGVPSQYDPDKTQNYEIGVKGDVLEHAFSFDASLYYIGWKDIQLNLAHDGFAYTSNGSEAKSQGVELSVESRPLTGLTLGAWVTYDDAVLSQGLPSTSIVYGVSGDRLPYSSRFSGQVSAQQDFPITGRVTGFVGGAVSYVGDRLGMFQGTDVRQNFPGYANTNLRAGAKYDSWTANLFATNLADKRGLLAGGLDTVPTTAFSIIQPRTVGLSVSKTF